MKVSISKSAGRPFKRIDDRIFTSWMSLVAGSLIQISATIAILGVGTR